MLFHTNFENPVITQNQKKMIEKEEPKPKPEQKSKLNFIVRSILPTKRVVEKEVKSDQENEVRLFEKSSQSYHQHRLEILEKKQQKKREKRKKYKKNRNKKMKVLK